MDKNNHFLTTLEEMKRVADALRDLNRELGASAEIRTVARTVTCEDDRETYRLPYATRPDFIGERWA